MVRLATIDDLESCLEIYNDAKEKFALDKTFQWEKEYPSTKDFLNDLQNNILLVYEKDGKVLGTVCAMFTPDPNYSYIDGKWISNEPYASIHRIATKKGFYHNHIGSELLEAVEQVIIDNNIKSIKVDTFELNNDMRSLLQKHNYQECGKIYIKRESVYIKERIAYQKVFA